MNNSSGRVTSQIAERRAKGAEWRRQVPLAAHAEWKPPANRADPVEVLIEQGKSRIQELLPVRYARMKTDPFAFLRGAAAIMAADLATCPATGLRVQACGDCHRLAVSVLCRIHDDAARARRVHEPRRPGWALGRAHSRNG